MNKKIIILLPLLSLFSTYHVNSSNILNQFLPKTPEKEIIVFGDLPKAEQQLKELKEKFKILNEKEKKIQEAKNKEISKITTDIKETSQLIVKEPQNSGFLNNKLELLNETYQEIKDSQISRTDLIELSEEHIKSLENYIKDPNLKEYIKEYTTRKRFYSFDDLQRLHQITLNLEDEIKSLKIQKQNAQLELESRKESLEVITENFEKKKKEREEFKEKKGKATTPDDMFEFNEDQKLELLTLQETFYEIQEKLNKYRIQEIKYKIGFIKTKIFTANLKLNIIKRTINDIRPTIRITESDIINDKTILEKEKTNSYKILGKNRAQLERISKTHNDNKKKLEQISQKYNIPLNTELDQWDINPKTPQEYNNSITVGIQNEYISFLNTQKELYEAQMAKNEIDLSEFKNNIEIKETFYKAETRKFVPEKDISDEIKKYNKEKLTIISKILKFKEKIDVIKNNLKNKNIALENINILKIKLNKSFKSQSSRQNDPITLIERTKKRIKKQIEWMRDSIDIYENIISINNKIEKQINFIISRLEQLIGKWYRPAYAIKFDKIPNIIPEMKIFIGDIKNYITQFSITELFEKIKMAFPQKIDLIRFITLLIMTLLILLLFKIYAPKIKKDLLAVTSKNKGVKFISLFTAFILDFATSYFISISIWIIIFTSIKMVIIPDRYITILFYLLSIPYLIYLANRLLTHFKEFNKKYNTLSFMAPQYQKRLINVIAIIVYSTIAIQLFRKAFELEVYYQSELPPILSALNWIIGQVALILLITKELIKKVIPKNFRWLQERSNQFYYIILAIAMVIIVMANPYIGLGRLLLYAIQKLILSTILVIGLYMLHKIIKRISLKLFFKSTDEVIQSRFTYGKTVYGLYVIVSFAILVLIGILLGSYIWDWGISLNSMKALLNKEIFAVPRGPTMESVSMLSFIKIFAFISSGVIISLLVNKYVLKRIFDLLLVDTGVQYAITSILKYVIITTFLVIGFNSVGLGELVKYILGALLLGIGWIIKDPLGDFIYYFLILIQRPLKIGDYIKLADGTQGVVRKITPRAVILKFRNSENILVPNSKLLRESIINWNYFTRFVAFNDIMITIPYKYDPNFVKKIFFEILDKHPNILKSPKPIIRLDSFGDYGYLFQIRGFLSSHYTLDMWDIASDIRLEIVKQLKENNIKIAVPIRIVESQKSETATDINIDITEEKEQ